MGETRSEKRAYGCDGENPTAWEEGGLSDGRGEDGVRLDGWEVLWVHVEGGGWGADDEGRGRVGKAAGAKNTLPVTGWRCGRSIVCFRS